MAHTFPFIQPQFFDSNGNPLAGGSLYSYAAGTSTPLATYTDQTEATPNTNPVVLDANGRASIWIGSSSYKFVLKDSLGNTIWTYDNVAHINSGYVTVGMLSNSTILYRWGGSAGGTANALTLTPSDTLSAYSTGLRYAFLATATNSGAATVNVSGLGPKAMVGGDGSALASGQIISGSMYSMTYDGTSFRVHELLTIANASITLAKLATNARDYVIPATVTANATVSYANDVYLVDCTSGAVTLTLYAASSGNKPIKYKKIDSTFNAVTIQRAGSDTIQDISSGGTSTTLNTQGEQVTIFAASSTTFQVTDRLIPSIWTDGGANTVNGSTSDPAIGTTTLNKFYWRRVGTNLEGRMNVDATGTSAAAGSGDYLWKAVPSGSSLTIDSTKTTFYTTIGSNSVDSVVGSCFVRTGVPQVSIGGIVVPYSTTQVRLFFSNTAATSGFPPQGTSSGGMPFSSGVTWSMGATFSVPITGWNS